ncbi:MAG: L,D-transpeptidase family protein, partial [Oxalobacteraceae bacterium]
MTLLLGNACAAFAANTPLWFVDGRATAEASEAVQILESAGENGLNPDDYQARDLARLIADVGRGAPLSDAQQSTLSVALTRAMESFISDLHFGRVNPRDIYVSFNVPPKQLDPAIYLREAVASHTLTAAVRMAAPQLPLYASLRQALAQYRKLDKNPALQRRLPPLPVRKIQPGQHYSGLADLAQKLIGLGDLPADTVVGTRYGGALIDGVKAFQIRHGLAADGVIGKSTLAQLNTPVAARIRQIELTLERLRWTPLRLSERMIVVNVPEFVLRAYEIKKGGSKVSMNVIVGKALDTRTPLFVEDMRFIEFSPYWNIPPSIAKAETVPRLLRDPAYFDRQGLEFVGGDGLAISVLSKANLDAVLQGQLRIRQRPGPANALGDIKFIFPNNDNIYLHHTPAVQLFKRDRRDFSHGCIRVEDPVALAKFVLQDQPEWTEERIRE